MSNTGYKLATVVYKRDTAGRALDINGSLCAETGLKQAIALRVGFVNPNSAMYVVEMYFTVNVAGEPTSTVDVDSCPIGGDSWILASGVWDMGGYWYANGIWESI